MEQDAEAVGKIFLSYAQHMPGGYLVYRSTGRKEVLFANDQFIELFDCESFEDLMERTWGSFIWVPHPDDLARVEQQLDDQTSAEGTSSFYVQFRIVTREGRTRNIGAFGRRVSDCGGEDLSFMFAIDLADTQRTGDVDLLTGLMGRSGFYASAARRMADEALQGHLALIWLDIDNFKVYNTRFGFNSGSALLQELAALLSSTFPNDLISRFADDHFVVLADRASAGERIAMLQSATCDLSDVGPIKLRAGIYYPMAGDAVDVACDRAKLACDSIRQDRSVGSCLYREDFSRSLVLQQYIIDALDTAIENGWIQLYHQPIIRALTGRICETEALVRWVDPQYGVLSPGEFLSTLEKYRLIHKLDVCVVRIICNEHRMRRLYGLPVLPVSVNLSRLDFELCDICNEVDSIVASHGMPKEMLKIEITESVRGEDAAALDRGIATFQEMGYQVWMDDFGSGYSSLSVLKDYDFDTIKFDMRFLSDFDTSDKSRSILSSNITMAKQIGIQALSEGVETEEQMRYLKGIGFEKIQGYLFGKPMPLDEIFELPIPKEDVRDAPYWDKIGHLELPDQSVMERSINSIADVKAMAIIEFKDERFFLLAENDIFRDWLRSIGFATRDEIEAAVARPGNALRGLLLDTARELDGGQAPKPSLVFSRGNCFQAIMTLIATNPRTGAKAYMLTYTPVTRFPVRDAGEAGGTLDAPSMRPWLEDLEDAFGPIIDIDGALC